MFVPEWTGCRQQRDAAGKLLISTVEQEVNSKERRKRARAAMGNTADALIDEIWDGKWEHIPGLHTTPIGTWPEILAEFETRCPDHTRENYEDALRRSMITRR